MAAERKINWAFLTKIVWTSFSAAILFLGWGACFADERCASAESTFLPFMLFLSFPAGPVAMLFMYLLVDGDTPAAYTLLWMAIYAAGFVQWSMITANIDHPRILKLNLTEPSEPLPLNKTTLPLPATRAAKKSKAIRLTRPFDKRGRTPLERALRKKTSR